MKKSTEYLERKQASNREEKVRKVVEKISNMEEKSEK